MRTLLTGAGGFIGAQLLGALEAAGHEVTPVLRRRSPAFPSAVIADLQHDDLGGLEGYEVVVHAASTTAGSLELLWNGNVRTTQRLTAVAKRTETPVVYISTTGVYGQASGRFGRPSRMPRNPSSALSVARAAAEDVVLEAGGTVIRPHVVHGPGDRWVVPPLVQFMLAENAWLGGRDITVAAISVQRLAVGVTDLIGRGHRPAVVHAAEINPEPVLNLVRQHFCAAGRPLPTAVTTVEQAYEKLKNTGVSRNALSMLGASSSMDTADFWGTGISKQPVPPQSGSIRA